MLISEEMEISIGQKADMDIKREYGVYNDSELQRYVERVGKRAAFSSHRPHLPYHFTVVDTPMVNAFALPGGYIYITRGLLAQINSEAELAGILGHEIGHVTAKHGVKRVQAILGYSTFFDIAQVAGLEIPGQWKQIRDLLFSLILLGYGRKDEFQADRLGVEYNFKAGYQPREIVRFLRQLRRMEKDEPKGIEILLASHPPTSERISKAEEIVSELISDCKEGDKLKILANEYKSQIDGLVIGPEKRGGKVKYLKVYTVKDGDTLNSVAKELLGNKAKAKEIADFNDIPISAELRSGDKLKIPPI